MVKSTAAFLLIAAVCVAAHAVVRIERMSSQGEPERFEFMAKWSAKKQVRHDCAMSGGGVVNGSTFIDDCSRTTGNYQCRAHCDCAYGGSRAGR